MAWRKQDRQITYGAAWRRARQAQLARDGYRCQIRLPACTTIATEVDHVDGVRNDPQHQRLRSACTSCHAKVTARQGQSGKTPGNPDHVQRTVW